MYKCKPERNPRQAYIIIIGCAIILLVIGIASSVVPYYNYIFQIMFVLGMTYTLFISYRYTMTEMVYSVGGDSFIATKTVGQKTTTVFSLDLSTAKALVDGAEYKKNKKKFGYIDKIYNCVQNMSGNYWYYICEFNGLTLLVKFEPNDIFVAKMKQSIEESKNAKDDDEDDE